MKLDIRKQSKQCCPNCVRRLLLHAHSLALVYFSMLTILCESRTRIERLGAVEHSMTVGGRNMMDHCEIDSSDRF